jgi:isoleucyl-tRNA synthetase
MNTNSKSLTEFKQTSSQIDFPKLEQEILKFWEKENIVGKYLKKNEKSANRFAFQDGPITANNPMGVHHAWGRTYKDIWQRYWNMRGRRQRFQNGFDCQGLWVEVEVEKELGIRNKKDIENLVSGDKKASIAKFVELCKERVNKYSKIQTMQSQRLGYFMNWDDSYFTMSNENNYMIWNFLKKCFDNDWIYKGKDCVAWCPRCETAISQHEMLTEDYKELTHDSIFIEYKVVDRENTFLLAWTTTPWTLPGNVAVAVDPEKEYVESEGEVAGNTYILIKEAAQRLKLKIKKVFKGKELIGLGYESPFDNLPRVEQTLGDYRHRVVASDVIILPVSAEEGTGIVHIAPGQGSEDYRLGEKENLPVIELINDEAYYLEEMNDFSGQSAKKHPEIIIDYLKNEERLFKTEKYTHRYPACWRCKTELVWKITNEWYIAMDKKGVNSDKETLREKMINVAKKIKWYPEFGLEREIDWLSNMSDWLISKKNRYWGLALPIYECQSCGNFEVLGGEDELKEKAVEGWEIFEGHSPHKPYIDDVKIKCSKCGQVVSRIDDVGNAWLDAGIVSFSTYIDPSNKKISYLTDKKYWKEWFPADFITESFPGQFKNWFYSMIAMSTVLENTNPFKYVLGFGTMFGEDGRPMHKSWGNSVEFNEGADKIGVDVMRWVFALQNPEQNLLFGYKKADETRRKFHLMLWNIYNFFVGFAIVDKFEPGKINFDKPQNALDKWILSRLNAVVLEVSVRLEKFNAQKAASCIEEFVNDLSLWYVRRSRDRVGVSAENVKDKKDCYQTLYEVLVTLSKLLAPFTPFLAEEIYKNLTGEESVHLTDWPKANKNLINEELEKEMILARQLAEAGHAFRKDSKIKVRIPLKKAIYNTDKEISDEILTILKNELNIYELNFDKKLKEFLVSGDTNVENQDIDAGDAREIIRKIQEERKMIGARIDERVDVEIENWPEKYEELIKRKALINKLVKAEKFKVARNV